VGLGTGGSGSRSRVLEGAAIGSSTRRDRLAAAGLILCPLISGLFFGAVSILLVLATSGIGHALVVGAGVGGAMFAANAAALCIVQATRANGPAPAVQSPGDDISEERAS
jgi:hypothetical protein